MILYFDSYITNSPLTPLVVLPNKVVRAGCKNYAMPDKLNIAKYSLASYALYPWSNVLIRYKLEDPNNCQLFDEFIKKLFPKAIIIHNRSDNQKEYKKSMEILDKMNDDWIFYVPNNDHPLIASDISIIDKLIDKAEKFKKKYQFVSINYSHFTECINIPVKGSPANIRCESAPKTIEDDETAISLLLEDDVVSIKIVNKDLFKYWFCSHDLGDAKIIRSENTAKFFSTPNQLVIIPKQELCAHFDGYAHLMRGVAKIKPGQIPPLFIPQGFFSNSIRIAFGYDDYREGWTNINPGAKKFSFEDNKRGTDLKIGLEDIPLFWKTRIKEIDINPEADLKKIKKGQDKYYATVHNPWKWILFSGDFKFIARFYYLKLLMGSPFRKNKFLRTPLKSTVKIFNKKYSIV